jgi:hypothetical protein
MRFFFWRDTSLRDFAQGIQPELLALRTPEPTSALKVRILASREAGMRIIVPVESRRRRRMWRAAATVAIAAALLLVLVPRSTRRAGRIGDVSEFASYSYFGQVALAQTLPAAPALPPARPVRAGLLRPMSVVYSRRIRDAAGKLTAEFALDMQVTADVVNGIPVWRIASADRNTAGTKRYVNSDTLLVTRSNLNVVKRAVHVEPYSRYARINVRQLFKGDSVIGRMTTDGPSIGEGRAIARRLPGAFKPYITDELAPLFFMAVPLDRTWRGSASLLGWAVRPDDVIRPVELRVEGEDSIVVPAGRFDCWRLSIRLPDRRIDYWVRKSDGLAIRLRDDSDAAKGSREIVLIRAS